MNICQISNLKLTSLWLAWKQCFGLDWTVEQEIGAWAVAVLTMPTVLVVTTNGLHLDIPTGVCMDPRVLGLMTRFTSHGPKLISRDTHVETVNWPYVHISTLNIRRKLHSNWPLEGATTTKNGCGVTQIRPQIRNCLSNHCKTLRICYITMFKHVCKIFLKSPNRGCHRFQTSALVWRNIGP